MKWANKQPLIFLMILISGFSLSVSITYAQVGSPSDTATFHSAKTKLQFQYPAGWNVTDGADVTFGGKNAWKSTGLLALASPSTPGVELAFSNLGSNHSNLKDVADQELNNKGYNQANVLQSKQITLNGKPGYMVLFNDDRDKRLLIFIGDPRNYLEFIYSAPQNYYDQYVTQVGNLIKSIQYPGIGINEQRTN